LLALKVIELFINLMC